MARTRTVRAFSAGGVVFRFVPVVPSRPLDAPSHTCSAPSSASSSTPAPEHSAPRDALAAAEAETLAGVEIALVGRTRASMWALPKGTPRSGERVPETALREVREETGLITRIVGELGSIYYTFTRAHMRFRKEVAHFLLEAVGGDVAQHDAEYDEVRWFPLDEALRRLTFANDADVVRRAIPLVARLRAARDDDESATADVAVPDASETAVPAPPASGASV